MKDKIIELLKQYEDTQGVYRCDYDELADEIVKLFVTKNDLKKLLLDYKLGHIKMHTVLDTVEAYSSASNGI